MEPFASALLTVREAAATLHVSEETIRRRVASGELQAVRIGGRERDAIRIPPGALRDLLQRQPRRRRPHE